MSRYTQGVCDDGAAILWGGIPLSVDEIVARLNLLNEAAAFWDGYSRMNEIGQDDRREEVAAMLKLMRGGVRDERLIPCTEINGDDDHAEIVV